ncbi:hypothetical protein BaRGS_00007249, partial [Batillaria attramentaria]
MWTWLGQCDARRFMERPHRLRDSEGARGDGCMEGERGWKKYLGIPYARATLGNLRFE